MKHMSVPDDRSIDRISGLSAAPELRLGLIDARTLMRDAVTNLLQNGKLLKEPASALVVLPFSDVTEFRAHCPNPAAHLDVVALNLGAAPLTEVSIRDDVDSLRDYLSGLPLVLMSDTFQLQALELLRQQGVKGYIPAMLTPAVVIEAMRLVWAGGTFIPSDLLNYAGANVASAQALDSAAVPKDLTRREQAVVKLLRRGAPNKLIAGELGISENTVKAYVCRIMKKLGAVNRTHACYLLQRASDAPVAIAAVCGRS
jgi:DNA-binding NarL/FixJ family response regulator